MVFFFFLSHISLYLLSIRFMVHYLIDLKLKYRLVIHFINLTGFITNSVIFYILQTIFYTILYLHKNRSKNLFFYFPFSKIVFMAINLSIILKLYFSNMSISISHIILFILYSFFYVHHIMIQLYILLFLIIC